jgi:hypothetical protein
MSSKKVIFAESMFPQDLTTMTMGSNYGLDGYEDMSYGMGVLEGVVDPALQLPPALPTGLSKGASEHLDLGDIIQDTPLNDLRWLSDFEPDPARLPDKPKSLDSVSQLQELWGDNRALTQKSAHETDLAVLRDRGDFGVRRAKTVNLGEIARKASRRVIAKVAPAEIAQEATLSADGDETRVRGIVGAVERERGLAGNVFIRAASFPGYGQGKWKSFVAQHAKLARYLVVDTDTIKSAAWIQDGRCTYTGKVVVTSVPWADAYAHYAPRLKAAGYVVPSAGKDPRKVLQEAFLTGPQQRVVASNLPTHDGEIKQLGKSEFNARAAAEAFEDRSRRSVIAKVEAIKARVESGEKGTILMRRIASTFAPSEQVEATKLLAPIVKDALRDEVRNIRIATDVVGSVGDIKTLGKREVDPEAIDRAHKNSRLEKIEAKVAKIVAAVDRGLSGEILRRKIASTFAPDEQTEAVKLLAPRIKNALVEQTREVKTARDTNERFQHMDRKNEELALAKKASAGAEKIVRVRGAIGWVRRAMNEGLAGKNLDDAVRHRFTDALFKEASENIARVRAAHEGLAGFRYIDASVYASKSGVDGCESGALKHRANQVKMLLAMDRCGSCALANNLPDGTRRCSTYNKMLVHASDFDAADLRRAKVAAIKMANSHDAEHTASLFAPKYDQAEFGLHNAALDNIQPDDLPENEKVKDIVFGGLIF